MVRLKEANRREVEEKAEHMRSMSWLAAIIAGFTMTAPIEFTYNATNPDPVTFPHLHPPSKHQRCMFKDLRFLVKAEEHMRKHSVYCFEGVDYLQTGVLRRKWFILRVGE